MGHYDFFDVYYGDEENVVPNIAIIRSDWRLVISDGSVSNK